MLKTRYFSAVALMLGSVALSGCGSGDYGGAVANSNMTAAVNASSVPAIVNSSFNFASGVPNFGTTTATSVKFTSASAFTVASAGGTAGGALSYGSCIFTVGTSSYPASSPLASGKTVTINPCNMTALIAGLDAANTPTTAGTLLVLGTLSSSPVTLPVAISDTGAVTLNGTTIGSVPLVDPTGGSGSGG